MYSPEIRRRLRNTVAELRDEAAWARASCEDDCDNSNVVESAQERDRKADRIAGLLAL